MNILNLTISYSLTLGSIYSDLNEELVKAGHTVKVVFADPSLSKDRRADKTRVNGVEILRVRTPKVQKVSLLKKGLAFLALPFLVKRATAEHYGRENFDLIMFTAPPVTLWSVVAWAKKYFKCPAYLMQKDIFPQNAVDLGMFSKRGIIHKYFRRQEINMLKVSERIGCMSRMNMAYIEQHNKYLEKGRVVYFPNTQKITPMPDRTLRAATLAKHGIPEDACVFLFGGNMGLPQYLELLCSAVEKFKNRKDVYFLCIGSGTQAGKLKESIESSGARNAAYVSHMPRDEYHEIEQMCDVGLVTLNPRYTIPNYPSKTLSYMNSAIPILAATDTNTDYRDLIETEARCGLWCESAKRGDFFSAIDRLAAGGDLRKTLGLNGRKYLEENFSVERSVKMVEEAFAELSAHKAI